MKPKKQKPETPEAVAIPAPRTQPWFAQWDRASDAIIEVLRREDVTDDQRSHLLLSYISLLLRLFVPLQNIPDFLAAVASFHSRALAMEKQLRKAKRGVH